MKRSPIQLDQIDLTFGIPLPDLDGADQAGAEPCLSTIGDIFERSEHEDAPGSVKTGKPLTRKPARRPRRPSRTALACPIGPETWRRLTH